MLLRKLSVVLLPCSKRSPSGRHPGTLRALIPASRSCGLLANRFANAASGNDDLIVMKPTRSIERGGWGCPPSRTRFRLGAPTPALPRKAGEGAQRRWRAIEPAIEGFGWRRLSIRVTLQSL